MCPYTLLSLVVEKATTTIIALWVAHESGGHTFSFENSSALHDFMEMSCTLNLILQYAFQNNALKIITNDNVPLSW